MGTYVVIGPCYRFDVGVRGLDKEKLAEVRKNASEFIDTDAFNCSVNGGVMSFTAKEELFIDGFVKLVERQYEVWGIREENTEDVETVLSRLSEAKTAKELIELTSRGGLPFGASYHYQNIDDYWHVNYFGGTCRASVHLIGLYLEGKAMLECFIDFFAGIEKLIKLDCPVPASKFMKVILTS